MTKNQMVKQPLIIYNIHIPSYIGLNTCSGEGKGTDKGRYTAVTFGEFAKIDAGCVCKKANTDGTTVLTYHDEDYCEDNLTNC